MNVPDGYVKPVPESGEALYLAYLFLPVMRHDENQAETVKVVPMIMSRN